jgi:YVTN family beta-propeller protein
LKLVPWIGVVALGAVYHGCGGEDRIPPALAVFSPPPSLSNLPRQSSPIAVSDDGRRLLNVNPGANTVSIFDPSSDTPVKLGEVVVGVEPNSVALTGTGGKAYVANTVSGTVSVLDVAGRTIIKTITVGAEPIAAVLSRSEARLYVANAMSGTVSVIDTSTDEVTATIEIPATSGIHPRALAVSSEGPGDDLDRLYVALFFAQLRPGKTGLDEGQDDNREGRVAVIQLSTNLLSGTITLAPITDTGFNSNGSTIAAVGTTNGVPASGTAAAPPTNPAPAANAFVTAAFPNQLAAVAINPRTGFVYVVSTGASPNGPFNFSTNVQGLISVADPKTGAEVRGTITNDVFQTAPLNLNRGVANATNVPLLFHSNPVAMAWKPDGSEAWVVVQTSDLLVRLTADPVTGIPTILAPRTGAGGALSRVDLQTPAAGLIAGKAPRGIAINAAGTRAYVSNFVSRSVSVVNLQQRAVIGTALSAGLPAAGSIQATVLRGAELFFGSRGPQGRLSAQGWGACIACHPDGRADGVTWSFPSGPRQTISLDSTFDHTDPRTDQRLLNFSAVRDEIQDFELNTRNVSGGRGLIDDDRPVYMFGGENAAGDLARIEEHFSALNTTTATNSLRGGAPLPALPTARRGAAVATLPDGRIYIIGGRSGAGGVPVVAGTNVLEFDPATNLIRARSSAGFTARFSLGAAAVVFPGAFGPRIYAIGGYLDDVTAPVTTVEEYNPATDTWRTVTPLNAGVAEMGVAVTFGVNAAHPRAQIHVVGGNTGVDGTVTPVGTIQVLVPDAAAAPPWTTLPLAITPRQGLGAASLLRGATPFIFAVAGEDGTGTLAIVEQYNANAPTALLAPVSPLPAVRTRFGIGVAGNQIFVAGGQDGALVNQSTIFQFNAGANPAPPAAAGPLGRPSGVWTTRAPMPGGIRSSLGASIPRPVNNFFPTGNSLRNTDQDAINEWVRFAVRPNIGPNNASPDRDAKAAQVANGRTLFSLGGISGAAGVTCATCHGGPKWTRSRVDYTPPPSTILAFGLQQVGGIEMERTATQPGAPGDANSVLTDVGTFAAARLNEVRLDPADVSNRIAAFGAKGFNIPSLLSAHATPPFFHNGLAETLEQVLNGSRDGFGVGALRSAHLVVNPAHRADLIEFIKSIDDSSAHVP